MGVKSVREVKIIKHWLTSDGYYLCIRACGPAHNKEKIAKTQDEVTCKNCLREIARAKGAD